MITTIFLLFIPLIFFFLNWFLKDFRKNIFVYIPFSFFIFFIPINQFFLSWFTSMTIENFYAYSILTYTFIFLYFLFLIICFFKAIHQKKISIWNFKINLISEKNYFILSLCFVISFIVLVVLERFIYVMPGFQDTYAYSALSNRFKESVYGFWKPNDISFTYKISQSYYFYSVMYQFPNEGYNFLTRITSYFIIMLIIFLILDKLKLKPFFTVFFFISFSFLAGFLSIFNHYYLSGGNIDLQFIAVSLSWAFLYSSLKYKNFLSCSSYLIFGFFSITGFLIMLIYLLSYSIVSIIKFDFKKIIYISPLIFYCLICNAFLIIGMPIIIFALPVIFSIAFIFFIFLYFINLKNNKFLALKIHAKFVKILKKRDLFFQKEKNNFLIKILVFITSLISFFITFLYLSISKYFPPSLLFLIFICLIIYSFGFFSSIFIFKNNSLTFILIFTLTDIFSLFLYIANQYYIENSSTWRVFYVNSLVFNTSTPFVHFLPLIFIFYFDFFTKFNFFKCWFFKLKIKILFFLKKFRLINKNKKYKLLIQNKKILNIKKLIYYRNYLFTKFLLIFSLFSIAVPILSVDSRFRPNFTTNFFKKIFPSDQPDIYFTKEDVSWLLSFNSIINSYDYIFSDAPLWNILTRGNSVIKSSNSLKWEGDIVGENYLTKEIILKNGILKDKPKYIVIWKSEIYTEYLLTSILNETKTFNGLSTLNISPDLNYIQTKNSSYNFLTYEKI